MRPSKRYFNNQIRPINVPFQQPMPLLPLPFHPWQNGPLMGQMMRQQFRGPLPFFNRFPAMQNQSAPLQNQVMNNRAQRGKRPSTSLIDESDKKRLKLNDSPPPDEQYIVPWSKGTEQITFAIWEYFLANKMDGEDMKKKLALQKTLHSIIKDSFPGSRLFIVGSSMTGFATRTSDVDMCLMMSDMNINQKKEAPSVLMALSKALHGCSFIGPCQVIRAKVPILKFTDRVSGFECDLNINNTIGIRNTHLLRYYAHVDWRVRPLMLYIKYWARYHDINDASKKTISSYSLSLMLIHYLQAGVKPPVLPCLQYMKPKLFSKTNDVRNLSLNLESIDFKSANSSTLGELFLGFLDYYSNIFSFDSNIVSVRKGRVITHDDVSYADSDWKYLCIEEPFEGTNTARSVYDQYVFLRILQVFQTSFHFLNRDRRPECIFHHPF